MSYFNYLKVTDDDIVELYKRGFSLSYISNVYYRSRKGDSNIKQFGAYLLLPRKRYNKKQATNYVASVIYRYIMDSSIFND